MNVLKPLFIACFLFTPLVFAQQSNILPCKSKNPDDTRPRIGLVLGGGGARGIAHVSILKEIERLHVPIDCIAGTSMGSLIGGLYASGMSVEELETLVITLDWNTVMKDDVVRSDRSFRRKQDDLLSLAPVKPGVGKDGLKIAPGFIAGENILLFLERKSGRSSGITNFNKLPIPFRAVATDINSGKAVVLSSGSLALAMRASMSVPGAFNPVEIDGRMLVDGGMVNQVPVDVARAMGADIIIAVDVGTPLSKIDATSSALAIADQVMGFLTVGNAVKSLNSLKGQDIQIQPDLGIEVTTGSFEKAALALEIGDKAAAEASPQLAKLASPQAYPRPIYPDLDNATLITFIDINNKSLYSNKIFEHRLAGLKGKPIDRDEIEKKIQSIYGEYPLELVSYQVAKRDDGSSGLRVEIEPALVGRNFGEVGINFSSNSEGQTLFNLNVGVMRAPLNAAGGEARILATIGDEPSIFGNWYQPLSADSPFFIDIKTGYTKNLVAVSDFSGNVLANYSNPNVYFVPKIGLAFGNWGELTLSAEITNGKFDRTVGSTVFPEYNYKQRNLALKFQVDTLDSLYLPRSGYYLSLGLVESMDSWGSDDSVRQINFDTLYTMAVGKHSIFGGLRYHENYDGVPAFQNWYLIGGVTNFAGYQSGEVAIENYGLGFLGYTYELGRLLNRPAVLGSTIEYGKLWNSQNQFNDSSYQTHGSIYLGFDSWLGLLIMGYGRSVEGDSNVFIELGRARF